MNYVEKNNKVDKVQFWHKKLKKYHEFICLHDDKGDVEAYCRIDSNVGLSLEKIKEHYDTEK